MKFLKNNKLTVTVIVLSVSFLMLIGYTATRSEKSATENDVGTIFVENNGYLVGAVSRKDFLKTAIGGTDINKVPVGIIMTRMPNIIYVEQDESVYSAAKSIIEREVDSLPVVEKILQDNEEKFKVVGKLSKTNITRLFVKMIEND